MRPLQLNSTNQKQCRPNPQTNASTFEDGIWHQFYLYVSNPTSLHLQRTLDFDTSFQFYYEGEGGQNSGSQSSTFESLDAANPNAAGTSCAYSAVKTKGRKGQKKWSHCTIEHQGLMQIQDHGTVGTLQCVNLHSFLAALIEPHCTKTS